MLKDKKNLIIETTFEIKSDQIIIQKRMTNNTKIRNENQPMYFGNVGYFFIWDYDKNGSMYEKNKESKFISYRIGIIMIYMLLFLLSI